MLDRFFDSIVVCLADADMLKKLVSMLTANKLFHFVLAGEQTKLWLDRIEMTVPQVNYREAKSTINSAECTLISIPEVYSVIPDDALLVEYCEKERYFSVVDGYLSSMFKKKIVVCYFGYEGNLEFEDVGICYASSKFELEEYCLKLLSCLEKSRKKINEQLPAESWRNDRQTLRIVFNSKITQYRTKLIRASLADITNEQVSIQELQKAFNLKMKERNAISLPRLQKKTGELS